MIIRAGWRPVRRVGAAVLAVALVASACGNGDGDTEAEPTDEPRIVQLNALYFALDEDGSAVGGASPVQIRVSSFPGDELRVGFTEDEVAGTGDQWRAAGWQATTTATLLTGATLTDREVTFDVSGRIDGPSAGAAMTVGVLAAFRGDDLRSNVTMTGTINPDGTVGPVSGIPQKVEGALESASGEVQAIGASSAGDTSVPIQPAGGRAQDDEDDENGDGDDAVMLIPAGQRNSIDEETGEMVDVVDLGRDQGVDVREVTDVYEAYRVFTGEDLPRLDDEGDTDLDAAVNDRIGAAVDEWLARYEASVDELGTLGPEGAELVLDSGLAELADEAAAAAEELSDEGLQAGAYTRAQDAAAFAAAAVAVGQGWDLGFEAWEADLADREAVCDEVIEVVDEIGTFRPETVSDASGLITAYTTLVDAVSLCRLGQDLLVRPVETEEEVITDLLLAGVYFELASVLILSSGDQLEFARDLGGTELADDVSPSATADFFRRAAEANLAAFDSIVIADLAAQEGLSTDIIEAAFIDGFIEYALAVEGLEVLAALDEYFGDEDVSAYARLGGALEVYALTSSLLAQFYSLDAELDDDLEIVAVGNEQGLLDALELGEEQLSGTIVSLRSEDVEAPAVVGSFEAAGLARQGDAADQFNALTSLWSGYVEGRMLAYLGGFETAGL